MAKGKKKNKAASPPPTSPSSPSNFINEGYQSGAITLEHFTYEMSLLRDELKLSKDEIISNLIQENQNLKIEMDSLKNDLTEKSKFWNFLRRTLHRCNSTNEEIISKLREYLKRCPNTS